MATRKRNWVKGAVKKPGSLRRAASRSGGLTKSGKIKKAWLKKAAKKPGKLGQRARLAITFGKMRKRKKR